MELAHYFRNSFLLLPGAMGVSTECEACVAVARHTADGFTSTPFWRARVAKACRRSWKRILGRADPTRNFFNHPSFPLWSIRLIFRVPLRSSKSDHRRPQISPCRRPVVSSA